MKKLQKSKTSITEKLRKRLVIARAQKVIPLQEFTQIKREVEKNVAALRKPDEIVKDGGDPIFAFYANVQHLLSLCSEILLQMPELATFCNRLEKLENEYMPSYPPMSPITKSYFVMWTLCDLRIGDENGTLAQIFANLGDIFGLDSDYLELIRKLANSRMSIYEHCGQKDRMILLRELVSNKEILFVGNSGYAGKKGELWYVRAVPPPVDFISYWTGMGTPHILRAPEKSKWLEFFERNSIRYGEVGYERRLETFLKFGSEPRYWSEFVFEAYSGHNSGALFLCGLPDVPESRPHSKSFDPKSQYSKLVANS